MSPPTQSPKIRLYVDADLASGAELAPRDDQAHYLRRVMRLGAGDAVAVFNGRDGEWRATLSPRGKRSAVLHVECCLRGQTAGPDIWLAFAPVKRPHIDFLVEKASELGVARLVPVMTRFTMVDRVNLDRLRANAIEAAEQSGRLAVPGIADPVSFDEFVAGLGPDRGLYWGDETGDGVPLTSAITGHKERPASVFVGPEGGFSDAERTPLHALEFARAVSLGPRILRADTAALVLLAQWQTLAGDL
jgi:16S rRNA (uracil1498-N3)-methyltransferase